MEQTSREAYTKIKASGLLSTRRFQVYEVLSLNGPMTGGEIWGLYLKDQDIQIDSVRPRLAELERLGVIKKIDDQPCSVTGMTCAVWTVTEDLPKELDKEMTNKQKIAFLKATAQIAAEELRKHGFTELANEVEQNLQVVK